MTYNYRHQRYLHWSVHLLHLPHNLTMRRHDGHDAEPPRISITFGQDSGFSKSTCISTYAGTVPRSYHRRSTEQSIEATLTDLRSFEHHQGYRHSLRSNIAAHNSQDTVYKSIIKHCLSLAIRSLKMYIKALVAATFATLAVAAPVTQAKKPYIAVSLFFHIHPPESFAFEVFTYA